MILVTIGTQKQSFKRLFDYINELKTDEKIIVQGGKSKYKFTNPQVELHDFFISDEMNKYINNARIIITHGGGGTIFKALEKEKKVIVFPRLKKYSEHINDHQLEITNYLVANNYVLKALSKQELYDAIINIDNYHFAKYNNNKAKFTLHIKKEIDYLLK